MTETHTDSEGDTTTHHVPRLRYRYEVGGRTYEGSRLRFGDMRHASERAAQAVAERYAPGSTVEIRHDPADPAKATVEAEKPGIWKIVFGAIFLVVAAFLMLVAWMMMRAA